MSDKKGNIKYVETIKRCECIKRIDDLYVMECKIPQRGKHNYIFQRGSDHLKRELGEKTLDLSNQAIKKLSTTVDKFDEYVAHAKASYKRISIEETNWTICYKRKNNSTYEAVLEIADHDNSVETKLIKNCSLEKLIRELTPRNLSQTEEEKRVYKLLRFSDNKTISENPLFQAAVANNDLVMQRQLKLYYKIATEPEVSWLSKLLKKRILPSLPEEYDKKYIVDSDTIEQSMIMRSGYTILHRPYFAMNGSTHEKWQLNPHTKMGVDAAKDDDESICFAEYLAMFDEFEEKQDLLEEIAADVKLK